MVLQFNTFEPHRGLVHAVTTAAFDGIEPFNLADHVGPGRDHALEHRKILCARLGIPFEQVTVPQQVHRGRIEVVTGPGVGRGAWGRNDTVTDCDGLITTEPGVPLMALSADCPLVLIYEPSVKVLAVVHASWRALVDRIIDNAIELFSRTFNCDPGGLTAGIGPSAGPCCYEVGEDFCEAVSGLGELERFIIAAAAGWKFDLQGAIRSLLAQGGVKEENIETMRHCTICDHRFFSYRRQGPDTGRFALIAVMK